MDQKGILFFAKISAARRFSARREQVPPRGPDVLAHAQLREVHEEGEEEAVREEATAARHARSMFNILLKKSERTQVQKVILQLILSLVTGDFVGKIFRLRTDSTELLIT
jgi:hypothetical protein